MEARDRSFPRRAAVKRRVKAERISPKPDYPSIEFIPVGFTGHRPSATGFVFDFRRKRSSWSYESPLLPAFAETQRNSPLVFFPDGDSISFAGSRAAGCRMKGG